MSKVTQLKAFRRERRKQKQRDQVQGQIAGLGLATASSWTSDQRLKKAFEAHATVLQSLQLHGQKLEMCDQSFQFMAAAMDYVLQERDGKGYDETTLKALGLENSPQAEASKKLKAVEADAPTPVGA